MKLTEQELDAAITRITDELYNFASKHELYYVLHFEHSNGMSSSQYLPEDTETKKKLLITPAAAISTDRNPRETPFPFANSKKLEMRDMDYFINGLLNSEYVPDELRQAHKENPRIIEGVLALGMITALSQMGESGAMTTYQVGAMRNIGARWSESVPQVKEWSLAATKNMIAHAVTGKRRDPESEVPRPE